MMQMLIFRSERVTDTMGRMHSDADDAALKRLVIVCILQRNPFGGVSFFVCHRRGHKNALFSGRNCHLTLRGHKNASFSGRCHQFHHPIHENAHFHGQGDDFTSFVHGTGPYRGRQDVSFVLCRMKNYSYL